jgi:hypothetical protein
LIENMAEYSPDLNLLDYYVWSALQEKVQVTPHANLAALHQSVHQGLGPPVAHLHLPDLLLFPQQPGGRHGEKCIYSYIV